MGILIKLPRSKGLSFAQIGTEGTCFGEICYVFARGKAATYAEGSGLTKKLWAGASTLV